MALHEARAGWHLDEATDFGGQLAEIYAEKIHLEPGKKHTIMAVDMFIDGLSVFNTGPDPGPARLLGEVYLAPYPVWDSATIGEFGVAGPYASNPMVLYKASFEYLFDPGVPASAGATQLSKLREFPTETIAAGESFDFYSNQLYMTVILTKDNIDTVVDNCHISMLVQVDDKEVNEVEHFMGAYAEMVEAQRLRLLMETSLRTSGNTANYSGYYFPSANYGGIRPELTVRGDLIQQFLTSGADNQEAMLSNADYRALDNEARQMQAYDEAFGGNVPLAPNDGVPDWLRWVRSEQFMMQERDIFPIRELDPNTMAVVML